MEEFLKDYVQMITEANDIELSESKLQEIVNSLRDEEELWDTVDSFVNEEIARAVKEDD